MPNEQRATSNEQRATSYQTPGFRLQKITRAGFVSREKADVPARSSRAFGVVAERAFGAVRGTLVMLAVCCLSVCFLVMQFGWGGQSVASSSDGDSSIASSDPSRPAPISLSRLYADNPDAFKTPEQPLVIDAGIVFAGQPTYLCFPIEKFGITNADDIIDITTSCECVTVEKVKYEDAFGRTNNALRARFDPKPTAKSSSLEVHIQIHSTNNILANRCLKFLNAKLGSVETE